MTSMSPKPRSPSAVPIYNRLFLIRSPRPWTDGRVGHAACEGYLPERVSKILARHVDLGHPMLKAIKEGRAKNWFSVPTAVCRFDKRESCAVSFSPSSSSASTVEVIELASSAIGRPADRESAPDQCPLRQRHPIAGPLEFPPLAREQTDGRTRMHRMSRRQYRAIQYCANKVFQI